MKKMLKINLFVVFFWVSASAAFGQDTTIIDEWKGLDIPPAPELKQIVLDAKTTAFLVLDMQKNSCTQQNRPRCAATIPKVQAFLKFCRDRGVFVAHSLTSNANPEDIVPELAPRPGEPVVKSSVDKFYKTDLEKILAHRGIKTVVIAGTAAHGAVLYTATGAAVRGMAVVVPVDGMSADVAFAEQYTAWHLVNSPGTRRAAGLTKFGMIKLK